MSDAIDKKVTETKPVKRTTKSTKVNSEEKRVTRGTRVPLGGFAGPLALNKQNQDPEMHYHWAMDDSEDGSKIERLLQAGYEFCKPEEKMVAGNTSVYSTVSQGSIVRVPAGQGKYHYLMKLPLEWYEDDQARAHERVDATERSLQGPPSKEGFYGEGLKIG